MKIYATRIYRPSSLRSVAAAAALLLAFACAGAGAVARAAETVPPSNTPGVEELVGPISLNDVNLDQVLEMFERWSGHTLLRPQTLPPVVVNLNLPDPIPKEEAMRAVETILQLNGIAITPMGDRFLKVTVAAQAKSEAPELIKGSTLDLPPSGRIASKLFRLQFLQIADLIPQLGSILSTATTAAPVLFDKANSALLTDSISNLQRVEILVNQLDQPTLAGMEPKFYSLHFAKASDVVSKVRNSFTGSLQNKLGAGTTLNADDRTNQIFVMTDARQYAFFDALIAKLDLQSEPNTRNEVIPLKSASAKDVATTLSQMVSGQNAAMKSSNGEMKAGGKVPALHSGTIGPNTPPSPAAAQVANPEEVDSSSQFSQFLTILPDERSNSLMVSGTVDDIRLIREFVEKIDLLLPQVRIEVVIAEVTLSDSHSTGISALGLKIEGDKLTGFNGVLSGLTIANGVITRPDGTNVVTGNWDLAAAILLNSTPRKSNANILSVPTIITSHNREGNIFVGESRPVISSYLNDTGGSGTTAGTGYRTTVSSTDIGIQLTVKPLIGADGSVQLDIKQEVNDVLGEVMIDGNPQPRIGRRTTQSFVSVHTGEILVLGGLQRSSLSNSTSRLGPVPIIGDLLGARTKDQTRTDLVFFLRPTILKPGAESVGPAVAHLAGLSKIQQLELSKLVSPTSVATESVRTQ